MFAHKEGLPRGTPSRSFFRCCDLTMTFFATWNKARYYLGYRRRHHFNTYQLCCFVTGRRYSRPDYYEPHGRSFSYVNAVDSNVGCTMGLTGPGAPSQMCQRLWCRAPVVVRALLGSCECRSPKRLDTYPSVGRRRRRILVCALMPLSIGCQHAYLGSTLAGPSVQVGHTCPCDSGRVSALVGQWRNYELAISPSV